MDFIEDLPLSNGFSVIMVIVDKLSKYFHFVPLTHPFIDVTVTVAFFHNFFKLHGLPASIVYDKGFVFLNRFWKELFRLQGVTLAYSSAYHP